MKLTLAFFTSTRGDMSIFEPLLLEIKQNKKIDYKLFVYGTHLEKNYGNTINEIKRSNFKITAKFKTVDKVDNLLGQSNSIYKTQKKINNVFKNHKFDAVVILGDRIERLPIITSSIIYRKPIIHIHGGEITEGVLDDQVRHMITKSAHLHFTICNQYKRNILNLSEEKFRVHNVGSLGVENLLKIRTKLAQNHLRKNQVILTYHPETINKDFNWKKNFSLIVTALNKFNFKVIITSPGHENKSSEYISFIKKTVKDNKKFKFIKSLGSKYYFNFLNNTLFVIGNSSSGIIELPYFRIPTINIGNRQKGRFLHDSVIQTDCKFSKIKQSINKANSKKFRKKIAKMKLHFGNGFTSKKILNIIIKNFKNEKKLLNKKLSIKN